MPVIHNRGKKIGDKTIARKIIFPAGWDKDGVPLKEKNGKTIVEKILEPGKSMTLTEEQWAHLRDMFPNELINIEDVKALQGEFKEKEPEKPREGYVAPDEVEARVAARVKEEMAKKELDKAAPEEEKSESREELIARIDAMDRPDLIAFIEKGKLGIEAKNYKAPGALKAAILGALENKKEDKAA